MYISRPTYRFILFYTCGLTVVIKRIWMNEWTSTLMCTFHVILRVWQIKMHSCSPLWSRGLPSKKDTTVGLINRFLMKLFSTSNMEIITYCRGQFDFELPSVILARHTSLFLDKQTASLRQLFDKKMLCVLNWPVLSWCRLFVVILRLFNFCLLNLFIHVVLGCHIRRWNKTVYNVSWICRERAAKIVNCCNYSYFV